MNELATSNLTTLAELANAEHRQCEAAAGTALDHAVAAGKLLAKAKQAVGHGNWSAWLAEHFQGSHRTARLYMRLADGSGRLFENGNALPISVRQAARLLADQRPERPTAPGAEESVADDSRHIPPADAILFFEVHQRDTLYVIVAPSSHANYYYVNRIAKDCAGGMIHEGSRRPLRSDAAAMVVREWVGEAQGEIRRADASDPNGPWENDPFWQVPWQFNRLLYHNNEEWIRCGLLGQSAYQEN